MIQPIHLLCALGGAFLLVRHVSGLLVFCFPRLVRVRPASEDSIQEELVETMGDELAPIGLVFQGAHVEAPPLARARTLYNFVDDQGVTWASAYWERRRAWLYFLTPSAAGVDSYILTADHKRPYGEQSGRRLVGGLDGADPAKLLAAHRKRIEHFEAPAAPPPRTPEERLAVAQAMFHGAASREVRLERLQSFIFGWLGVALFAFGVVALLRHG